jgi:hypothetical protein
MIFSLPVDRHVSSYLSIQDFVQFRKSCRVLYRDEEAWSLRAKGMPMNKENPREKIALNYLLQWSMKLPARLGSNEWYQEIVNWLQYHVSIKLIHSFIRTQHFDFLYSMDLSRLSPSQRLMWLRLWHRYGRLYKPKLKQYYVTEGRPAKRIKLGVSRPGTLQSCYG